MDLVTAKGSLSDHILINEAKNAIVTKISSIPNFSVLKFDIELMKYVANLVKNLITSKNKTIDSKNVIIEILTSLFSISDQEKTILEKQIDFLESNGHLKVASLKKKVKTFVTSWVTKKIL
jgi:hypothetical protein